VYECNMLCFSNNTAISYISLLVPDKEEEPVIEQWNILDLSKNFYIWNIVILIDQCKKKCII
jgi:hypothetical protein